MDIHDTEEVTEAHSPAQANKLLQAKEGWVLLAVVSSSGGGPVYVLGRSTESRIKTALWGQGTTNP